MSVLNTREKAEESPPDDNTNHSKGSRNGEAEIGNGVGNSQLVKAPNPFNVDDLVVTQEYVQCCGPKQQLTIPKRKPDQKSFLRICPNPEYQMTFSVVEFKDDNEIYIVHKSMAHLPILRTESYLTTLYVGMTKQGALFVWSVRLPDQEGKQMACHKAGHEAAKKCMASWHRIVWDKETKSYNTIPALNNTDFIEPVWNVPYMDILRTAFGEEGIIDRPDHPAIKKLLGQI